VLTVK
jgi:hypothetical protein